MFDVNNYSAKPKYYDDSNKLVVGKMEDEAGDFAIKEFVRLKPKMCTFLLDVLICFLGVNKNFVATISHNEYKDVLLNKKCYGIPRFFTLDNIFKTSSIDLFRVLSEEHSAYILFITLSKLCSIEAFCDLIILTAIDQR